MRNFDIESIENDIEIEEKIKENGFYFGFTNGSWQLTCELSGVFEARPTGSNVMNLKDVDFALLYIVALKIPMCWIMHKEQCYLSILVLQPLHDN